MHASVTAKNGAVGKDTIFLFSQDNWVRASYSGGQIVHGYLIGKIEADTLTFRYCQQDISGSLDGGVSDCSLEQRPDGGIRIIERFYWESRQEEGVNVIEDMPQLID